MVYVADAIAAVPERVHSFDDPTTGLKGAIVIHSTRMGPAAGGCRFHAYASDHERSMDAIRLAEGMSYKNALAGLPLGGGKAVLQMPACPVDRAKLFQAFGREVAALRGAYVTAEDVGTTVADMAQVRTATTHVAGLPAIGSAPGGDPSPSTARGVFLSIELALERKLGRPVKGATIAVQGLGAVGFALCTLLDKAGARLIIAEPRTEIAKRARKLFGAEQMSVGGIVGAEAEVFAPCAFGAVLTARSIRKLKAQIVCGAANNQLATAADGDLLADRRVLYAPDYVVNAGGIINVAAEYLAWDAGVASARVEAIPETLRAIFDLAERESLSTARAADRRAREIIAAGPASGDERADDKPHVDAHAANPSRFEESKAVNRFNGGRLGG